MGAPSENRHPSVPDGEHMPVNLGVVVSVRGSVVDIRFDGHLPPIYSVLRAGDEGRIVIEVLAQRAAYRAVTGDLKLAYAQFEELETFSRFGARLDEDTRKVIEHGHRIRACLKQPEFAPVSVPAQITVLLALAAELFDRVPLDQMTAAEHALRAAAEDIPAKVRERLDAADKLSDEDREAIIELARKALDEFQPKPEFESEDEETTSDLNAAYVISRQRTVQQDAAFGIRQIVDIALKALSPGINDSTTAVMCVDYLTAILARLASRRIATSHLLDQGELRVILHGPTFASLLAQAFDQIRQTAGGNVSILLRMLGALQTVDGMTSSPSRRRAIHEQLQCIAEVAERTIASPYDRVQCDIRLAQVREALTPFSSEPDSK